MPRPTLPLHSGPSTIGSGACRCHHSGNSPPSACTCASPYPLLAQTWLAHTTIPGLKKCYLPTKILKEPRSARPLLSPRHNAQRPASGRFITRRPTTESQPEALILPRKIWPRWPRTGSRSRGPNRCFTSTAVPPPFRKGSFRCSVSPTECRQYSVPRNGEKNPVTVRQNHASLRSDCRLVHHIHSSGPQLLYVDHRRRAGSEVEVVASEVNIVTRAEPIGLAVGQ